MGNLQEANMLLGPGMQQQMIAHGGQQALTNKMGQLSIKGGPGGQNQQLMQQ